MHLNLYRAFYVSVAYTATAQAINLTSSATELADNFTVGAFDNYDILSLSEVKSCPNCCCQPAAPAPPVKDKSKLNKIKNHAKCKACAAKAKA